MLRRREVVVCGVIVVALALLAGCTSATPAPDDTSEPLVLSLATDDEAGELVASQQIQHLVDQVAAVSDGQLTIQPNWNANGDVEHNWDQATARRVIDGKDDLAVVPSRAWDELDVTSLQALSVPMLITSEELTSAVVAGELAPQLLSGLPAVGVTGLSLYPESLRHPFGLRGALVEPADFAGGQVRVPASAASTLLYKALGATAVDGEPDPATMIAQDTDYGRDPDGTATGNLVWYPKVNVLVANTDALNALTAQQRDWLNTAATDTQKWAIDTMPTDAEAAAAWCAGGGTIVAASDAGLSAFADAVVPVTKALTADAVTAEIVAGIEDAEGSVTAAPVVDSCPAG